MAAVFSRDGRKLFTSTRLGTLHVWDLATGRAIDLPRQGTEACAIAVAPNGRLFATATGFGIVRLWQTDSLRQVGPVYRCEAGVHALAFSPDGRRLAMGMQPSGVAVAELPPTLEAAPPVPLSAEIHAVSYTPDGNRLLAGTRRGALWLDAVTNKPLGGFVANPENFGVESTALSSDGKSLAMGRWSIVSGGRRGRAELWDVATGERRWQSPDQAAPVGGVAYSPDGRTLFSRAPPPDTPAGGALWDVATGERLRPLLTGLGGVRIRRAVFHPDGRQLLLGCDDGRARLWDVSSDSEIEPDRPLAHAGAVTAVACDATGGRILTGCRDGTARLWDTRTRTPLAEPLRHEAEVSAVAFSPDGRTLLTGSLDGTAHFWDAASGLQLGPTLGHGSGLRAVAFHPDGGRVAAGSEDGTAYQWHVPALPIEGTPEQVRLWVETLSGLALDEQGGVHKLPDATGERR
jgi:WD40 repeat protein